MCLHILGFNAAHLEIYESIYRNVCLYVFRVHHVQMNVQCMPFSFFSYMYLCCIQPKYFREICSPIFISVCCSICAATVPNLCKASDQFAREHTQEHSNKSHCIDCANFIERSWCDNKLAQRWKKSKKHQQDDGTNAARRNATKFSVSGHMCAILCLR